ncbi:MAG TPA: hypothetical protein VF713_05825, partial [Thermoanaerobaculia bacterium]
ASALAFADDPFKFHKQAGDKTPQERLAERILTNRASGTRSGAAEDGPLFVAGARASDEAGGSRLFETLLNLPGV